MTHEPLSRPDTQLELDGAALRELLDRVAARLAGQLDSLAAQPASADAGQAAEVARSLAGAAMPETGAPLASVLDLLFERVFPAAYNTTSPGFFGYLAGGGIPQAAVADLIAGVANRFVGRWSAAPAAAQLEANVVRWFAELIGFPAGARGVLTSGGSLANLTAVFTARQRAAVDDLSTLRLYVSDQVHFSIPKAAAICGLPRSALRRIRSDPDGRMDVAALADAIRDDRRGGARPFLIVASAGTFLTGAVDDLAAIAAVARAEQLWFHVDAAFGGFFLLTERGRALLDGIARADSVTLDPHKGLFLPYGTGALLVRNGQELKRAHEVEADFYGPQHDDGDAIDFGSYSIEQTRPFRGLRVWLPLALHGIAPFRHNLDEKLDLARRARDQLAELPGIEIVAAPTLTVVVFRLVPPGGAAGGEGGDRAGRLAASEALNRALIDRVNAQGNAFVMGIQLKGEFAVRMCILSFRAHLDRVVTAIDDVRAAAIDVLAQPA